MSWAGSIFQKLENFIFNKLQQIRCGLCKLYAVCIFRTLTATFVRYFEVTHVKCLHIAACLHCAQGRSASVSLWVVFCVREAKPRMETCGRVHGCSRFSKVLAPLFNKAHISEAGGRGQGAAIQGPTQPSALRWRETQLPAALSVITHSCDILTW